MCQADPIDSGIVDWLWDGRMREMFGYSDADLGVFARVLCRKCPHCGANPGELCKTRLWGRQLASLDDQHLARRVLT